MTGSVQTKSNRKNYFAVLNIYDENGKRKLKWVDTGVPIKGNNKRKANVRLQEILSKYDESGINSTKDTNFTDFMRQWLEMSRLSISPTTHDAYKMTLDVHIIPYFEKKKLKVSDITPVAIQQYVSYKLKSGLSPNTVRKHLANISKCLDGAVKQNIITYNPVKRIEMPKKERYTGAKHYNEKQIEQLFECSRGDPLEIAIRLTLFYGLRRSEVLGLRWDVVDLEKKILTIKHTVVRITKTTRKQDRTKNDSSYSSFPIPEKLILELKKCRERQQALKTQQPNDYHDSGYICIKENGEIFSPDYISQHFSLLLMKNNMPHIRFHDLRHSSASYLKHLGFDLKDIQTWLRHKDIQTTMNLYTHLDMESKLNIADSLDAKFQFF